MPELLSQGRPANPEFEWTVEFDDFEAALSDIAENAEFLALIKGHLEEQTKKLLDGQRSFSAPEGHLFKIKGQLKLEKEVRYSTYGDKGWAWNQAYDPETRADIIVDDFFCSSVVLSTDENGDYYLYAEHTIKEGNYRTKLGKDTRLSIVKINQIQTTE